MPSAVPRFAHPSAIDVVVESRAAIGAMRLGLLAVTVYVVISIAANVGAGRWVVSAAGISTATLGGDRGEIRRQLVEAETRYAALKAEYAEAVERAAATSRIQGGDGGD